MQAMPFRPLQEMPTPLANLIALRQPQTAHYAHLPPESSSPDSWVYPDPPPLPQVLMHLVAGIALSVALLGRLISPRKSFRLLLRNTQNTTLRQSRLDIWIYLYFQSLLFIIFLLVPRSIMKTLPRGIWISHEWPWILRSNSSALPVLLCTKKM